MSGTHRVDLDVRRAELIEQAARGLAADLPLVTVDGYRKAESPKFILTDKGPMAYFAVRMPRGTGLGFAMPEIDHYLLMGLIPPNAPPETWFEFPILLKRIAAILGAGPDLTELRNGVKVEEAKGHVRSEADATVQAGSGLVTRIETSRGVTEAQSITLRWSAKRA